VLTNSAATQVVTVLNSSAVIASFPFYGTDLPLEADYSDPRFLARRIR
jgi:hypothetical protein